MYGDLLRKQDKTNQCALRIQVLFRSLNSSLSGQARTSWEGVQGPPGSGFRGSFDLSFKLITILRFRLFNIGLQTIPLKNCVYAYMCMYIYMYIQSDQFFITHWKATEWSENTLDNS